MQKNKRRMRQFCINNHCRQAGAINTVKAVFIKPMPQA